jgi:type VI secretion system protein ImpM
LHDVSGVDSTSAVGFYGKLPSKGDFLQRRVSTEFIDVWDPWLQECMHLSRQALQANWLNAYLTSPVWRFVLAEGVCGSGAFAGVMVPSVDRVGRYFPLTLVAQLDVADCVLEIACGAGQQWFDAAEALALGALESADLDLELFDSQVASLAGLPDADGVAESVYLRALLQKSQFGRRTAQWHTPLVSAHSLQHAINLFATRELERTLRPLALWWTHGSDVVAPAWLCNNGLPAPESFVAMLAADWQHTGWESLDPDSDRDRRMSPATLTFDPEAAAVTGADRVPEGWDLAAVPADTHSMEILAWHEPVSRISAEPMPIHFVTRPDVGIWGVTSAAVGDERSVASQSVADMLQSMQQGATLSSLVEVVRRSLELVGQQLRPQSTGEMTPMAQTILFLAHGTECAFVYSGDVQVIRCRSAEVTSIVGLTATHDSAEEPSAAIGPATSLMALIESPIVSRSSISVLYESLVPGDVWLLSSAPLLNEFDLPRLLGVLTADEIAADAALAAVRALAQGAGYGAQTPLPTLFLKLATAARARQR